MTKLSIEKHKSEIDRLREVRRCKRLQIDKITKETEDVLNKFGVKKKSTRVDWNEASKMPHGQILIIDDHIRFVKTKHDENEIIFVGYMTGSADYGHHFHSDMYEFLTILEGHMIERTRGNREYKQGETVIYAPNEEHQPTSEADSIFEIKLKRKL